MCRVAPRRVVLGDGLRPARLLLAARGLPARGRRLHPAARARRRRRRGHRGHEVTVPLLVPVDMVDGVLGAYWRRPEAYLDPAVRANCSGLALADPAVDRPRGGRAGGRPRERGLAPTPRRPARPRLARPRLPPRRRGLTAGSEAVIIKSVGRRSVLAPLLAAPAEQGRRRDRSASPRPTCSLVRPRARPELVDAPRSGSTRPRAPPRLAQEAVGRGRPHDEGRRPTRLHATRVGTSSTEQAELAQDVIATDRSAGRRKAARPGGPVRR